MPNYPKTDSGSGIGVVTYPPTQGAKDGEKTAKNLLKALLKKATQITRIKSK